MPNLLERFHVTSFAVFFLAALCVQTSAQVLATGDSRGVVEPTFPVVCTTLPAQQATVSGGPASETMTDTARIQSALNACASGKAVELTTAGSNNAFLIAPINIPSGVGLIVDGGVTVYGSRNREDYQTSAVSSKVDECGTDGVNGNGCKPLINVANGGTNSGAGIYGYGVIDARGYATTLKNGADTGVSWWMNSDDPPSGTGQNNPYLLQASSSSNFTLYKITLKNSPEFHVKWTGGTGLTAWGVKIITPFSPHNTDGIDPDGKNITIAYSWISDGDDNIAVGAGSTPSANVTVSHVNTYSGHGISVGSYTSGGLNNFLVTDVNMAGTATDKNATGLRLKSAADRGGLVSNVTYQNICARDMREILYFDPFYDTGSGTKIPQWQNIVLKNVHFLAPTASTYPYVVKLQGYDINHISTITLDDVVFDKLSQGNITSPQYDSFTLMGNVYPAFLQSLTGTGVSYTGSATAVAGGGVSACANPFTYVAGELYLSTPGANNLQSASVAQTDSVSLHAMVQPTMSQVSFSGTTTGSWTGVPALSKPVEFYEGSTEVGSANLADNGTLATVVLSNLVPGVHTYTARYPGDANYAALNFGSVQVTVSGPIVQSTTSLSVPASLTYGSQTSLQVNVSAATGTPTGNVSFFDGATLLGTVSLTAGTATLPEMFSTGSHVLSAMYGGDATYLPSTSAKATLVVSPAQAAVKVTATPASVAVTGSVALQARISGVANGSVPGGQVVFSDGANVLGTATLDGSGTATVASATMQTIGNRTITAAYSGDANYQAVTATAAVTVNAIATTLTVSASGTVYPGAAVVLHASLQPAVSGASIVFANGSTVLSSVQTDASGVATYTWTAPAVGTYSVSASFAATGNYAGATSAAVSVGVVNPVSLTLMPASLSISPGTSGVTTVTLAGNGGFSGTASLSCSSPVNYITCTVSNAAPSLAGGSATSTVTIAVAATLSSERSERPGNGAELALAGGGLVIAFTGLRRGRRRFWTGLAAVLLLLSATLGTAGCGAGASSPVQRVPSGPQQVTLTASAAGAQLIQGISVNVQ